MQTIQGFFTQAIERDFSRDFLFEVTAITFGNGGGAVLDTNDLVYATTASLPARTISDIPVKYRGLEFHVPGSVTYEGAAGWNLNFYCDANIDIRLKLLRESRRVFDDQTTTGSYRIGGASAIITLNQLNKQLQPIVEYQLIGCSIRNVGPIAYSMADGNGAISKFDVTMAYHYFTERATGNREPSLE